MTESKLKIDRVLIISYFFWPSQRTGARRPTELALALAGRGVDVSVVTCAPPSPCDIAPLHPKIHLHYIPQPGELRFVSWLRGIKRLFVSDSDEKWAGGNSGDDTWPSSQRDNNMPGWLAAIRREMLRLIFAVDGYKRWSWRAAQLVHRLAREKSVDVIVSSGPPHSVHLGALRAARQLNVVHVVDLRNPWTDDRIRLDFESEHGAFLGRVAERYVMRRSAAIVCSSLTLAALLAARYPRLATRVFTVYNGVDGGVRHRDRSTGRRLDMIFAGDLYGYRDPFPLLMALDSLLQSGEIDGSCVSLTMVGSCESYRGMSVLDWCRGKSVEKIVRIGDRVGADEVEKLIDRATLLLNFAQQQPLQIPAKTFEHLASSREALVLCEDESDTARIVDGVSGVTRVAPSDKVRLCEVLRQIYKRHVDGGVMNPTRSDDADRYSRRFQNALFIRVLERAAAESRTQ